MRETPVTVVGTLVSETRKRRVGPDGDLVLNFRVVATERRYDKASGTWVDGDSLYLTVCCWRSLAENAASLAKGDPVIVRGRLRTREWTTEHGERRSRVELYASAVGPDLARCTATVRKLRRGTEPAADGHVVHEVANEELGVPGEVPESVPVPESESVPEAEPGPDEVSLAALAAAAGPLVPA